MKIEFFFKIFASFFPTIYKGLSFEASNYKNEHIEQYTKKQNNKGRLAQASLLKLKKGYKPINIFTDGMDKFQEKELMKKRIFAKKLLI